MAQPRMIWRYLPIAVAALVTVAGCLLLLTGIVLGAIRPGHPLKLVPGLFGVTVPQKPVLRWRTVLDGEYQRLFGMMIGERVPLYPAAVRLRNQVAYSVFGQSANPGVVVGRGRQLVERVYIDEYCTRSIAELLPRARAWAVHLRQIQDDAERRGQTFLYVVTPSKVAQEPWSIPGDIKCPASQTDRDGYVDAWLTIVRDAGIHVADAVGAVHAARSAYPFPLFPRGGTHWNAVGASIGLDAVDAQLQAIRHDGVFGPYRFTWTMTDHPQRPDTDLALLTNLIWPPDGYSVPVVTPVPVPPMPCPALRVVVVSGSFMGQVSQRMSGWGCHPDVTQYEYWVGVRLHDQNGVQTSGPVDPVERDRAVLAADVLLLEENEQTIARSNHGPPLWSFLARQPGWTGQPAAGHL